MNIGFIFTVKFTWPAVIDFALYAPKYYEYLNYRFTGLDPSSEVSLLPWSTKWSSRPPGSTRLMTTPLWLLATNRYKTINNSVLGPVLFALFVSPHFDLTKIVNYADDNFCLEWNRSFALLVENLEKKLEMITKWLKGSGLVVNESKTEVCLFHRNDQPLIFITLAYSQFPILILSTTKVPHILESY